MLSIGGKHLQAVDRPISIRVRPRVVLHVILAGVCFGGTTSILGPYAAGPVSAESGVEDDVVVFEMVVDVAGTATLEVCHWLTPVGGVGAIAVDV